MLTISPDLTFTAVSLGQGCACDSACGIRTDDRITCWGQSAVGAFLDEPSLDRFLSVAAGTCGLCADHHLVCWGTTLGI